MSTTINAADWWFAPYIKHAVQSLDFRLFMFLLRNNLFFESWDVIAVKTLDFIFSREFCRSTLFYAGLKGDSRCPDGCTCVFSPDVKRCDKVESLYNNN
jgi:hypothetical protein